MSPDPETLSAEVPPNLTGLRLDQALAALFADYSRSRLQAWVKAGQVLLDGAPARPRDKVLAGQHLSLRPDSLADDQVVQPQPIPIDVEYRDEHLVVLHKPAGLVVHPAVGNRDGTLQNGLLHLLPGNAGLPRAGIVHRLDKDTSGLMVVACSELAHKRLVEDLQARNISREYLAVVNGIPVAGGTVEEPVGRHPTQRTRMAVVRNGKPAVTHYRVQERFRRHALLALKLETGRTHQIRVHMAYVGHPLLGDPVYGGKPILPKAPEEALVERIHAFRRQALHAFRLGLRHPATGETMTWERQPPADMQDLIAALRTDRAAHAAD